jgi:catechol 2,3-dioxygenase-like lactoylglutathione lyase family enzyme
MESILDHLNVPVKETARAKAFYVAALAPLGISLVVEVADERGSSCGFGAGAFPELWVGDRLPSYQVPADRERLTPLHVALRARSRAQSTRSTERPSQRAVETWGHLVCEARAIRPGITRRSCSISTATTSKPFAAVTTKPTSEEPDAGA